MNILEEKTKLINKLDNIRNDYVLSDIEYRHKKCRLLLETDFASVLEKSRPTVDEKNAYVDLQTMRMRQEKELLKNKIKTLKMKIELCNDKIALEVDK